MPCTGQQLQSLLAEGPLAGREVTAVPIEHSDDELLAVRLDPSELLDAHQAAKAVLDRSGRWPVATLTWGGDVSDVLRTGFNQVGTVADVLARDSVRVETARDALERGLLDSGLSPQDWADVQRRAAERAVGSAPPTDEILAGVGSEPTERDFEQWMLEWERANGAPDTDPGGTQEWFDPPARDCWLAFPPTDTGEDVLAYLPFWAEENVVGATPEVLIAFLRSWREQFGAELVAHWGTMLQFVVSNPPTTFDEAWTLAWDHHRVAPCTNILPGIHVREAARSLVGADRWFLHERP